MTPRLDDEWAEVARGARRALVEVGQGGFAACMPDEAEPCGASAQMHALSYFAVLQAVCAHQLAHLGADLMLVTDIQLRALEEIEAGCQGVHE